MKPAYRWTLIVVAGLVLGVGSALWVLRHGGLGGKVSYDHWLGNANTGSAAADPYTRSVVAAIGLLALNRSEAIYFNRYVDDSGAPLAEGCTYEMRGAKFPTRWWSITAYAADNYLPVNGQNALSVDATRVSADGSGAWVARLAKSRESAANWIATQGAGTFSLTLRLYNPDAAALEHPEQIGFPSVVRLSCEGAP